jgi:hypothetical protein
MMSVSWISPWSMDYAVARGSRARCEARQQTYALAAGPMMVGDPKLRCVNNQPPVTVRRYVSIRLGHICSAPYVRWRTCVDVLPGEHFGLSSEWRWGPTYPPAFRGLWANFGFAGWIKLVGTRSPVNEGRASPQRRKSNAGTRVVGGCKELSEKLGRNDPCPCLSGRRFEELLHAQW